MLADISYKNYKKKNDIHGTVLYPAVMIAPVQKEILDNLVRNNDINTVFDPFHGSGTSLYEAYEVSQDLFLSGCDINPLANLITKVKLQGVNDEIYNDIEVLKQNIKNSKVRKAYTFNNSSKWFREDIAIDLTKIQSSIRKVKHAQNRRYFWYIMCDLVRKYSNTRSSTYKLHSKEQSKIDNMVNNVIEDYIKSVQKNVTQFKNKNIKFKLYKRDILEQIIKFKKNSFGISITSPPYGDNATTVPYGQFSSLSLRWIDKKDLKIEGWEFDSYSKIDSFSLGGLKAQISFTPFEMELINPYVKIINNKKKIKVERFFSDYFIFLKELCRVTEKYIVMTLGNRTVDGVPINLTQITMSYLENFNFELEHIAQREILNKRTPKRTSKVNDNSVSSMNDEYVIIYKKV